METRNSTLCGGPDDSGAAYVVSTWLLLGVLMAFILFGVGCLVARRVCHSLKHRYAKMRTRPRGHIYEDVRSVVSMEVAGVSFRPVADAVAEQTTNGHHYVNEPNQQQSSNLGDGHAHNDSVSPGNPNGVAQRSHVEQDWWAGSSPPCRSKLHRKRRWMPTITNYFSKSESSKKHIYCNVVHPPEAPDNIYLRPAAPVTPASQEISNACMNEDPDAILPQRNALKSEDDPPRLAKREYLHESDRLQCSLTRLCHRGRSAKQISKSSSADADRQADNGNLGKLQGSVVLNAMTGSKLCKCKCHRKKRWRSKFTPYDPKRHLYCNVHQVSEAAPNSVFPQPTFLEVPKADTNIFPDEGDILLRRQAIKSETNPRQMVEVDNHVRLSELASLRNSTARSSTGRKSVETGSSSISSCRVSLFSRLFNTSEIPYIDE